MVRGVRARCSDVEQRIFRLYAAAVQWYLVMVVSPTTKVQKLTFFYGV